MGPLHFLYILQQNGCSKNPKGSSFTFYGTMRLTGHFWKFFPHSGTVEENFWHFEVLLLFLSLRYGAHLGRSPLVSRLVVPFHFWLRHVTGNNALRYTAKHLLYYELGNFAFRKKTTGIHMRNHVKRLWDSTFQTWNFQTFHCAHDRWSSYNKFLLSSSKIFTTNPRNESSFSRTSIQNRQKRLKSVPHSRPRKLEDFQSC